jgi:hypothetical protein
VLDERRDRTPDVTTDDALALAGVLDREKPSANLAPRLLGDDTNARGSEEAVVCTVRLTETKVTIETGHVGEVFKKTFFEYFLRLNIYIP